MKIQTSKARTNIRSTFFTDRAGAEFQKNFEEKCLTKIVNGIQKTCGQVSRECSLMICSLSLLLFVVRT